MNQEIRDAFEKQLGFPPESSPITWQGFKIGYKAARATPADHSRDSVIEECIAALYPLASLGGPCDMQAFHDLEDNVVVYQNSGVCITAGDARHARELIGKITGKAVSMMHHRLFDPEEATFAENYRLDVIEECCAAIKAEDDRMADDDYMLDSDDCIRVCRALKSQQDAAIESQRSGDGESS